MSPVRTLHGFLVFLCAGSAWAALGGNVASVQSDQQAFGASSVSTTNAGGTLYTLTSPNGVVVRQYVDTAGTVYAVGWDGPVLPDFQRLLGSSFSYYQTAVVQQRRGVNLQTPTLVIESSGMMRSFVGRAYLPTQVPAAVKAQDIR